ncbi:MAG: Urease accessory protein UreD [Verrucomicrobiaceae bacterium]|nr:Urease accessory protein UreD [Verrucomicrobiaceae bacterium]
MPRPTYFEEHSDSSGSGAAFATSKVPLPTAWRADLYLRFALQKQRTVLVRREHSGPLVVQKALYPEGDGVCHAIIVHPPGGIAGGDELQLRVDNDEAAHALLTTPGAGKWYKANGREAAQHLNFVVANNAVLEWLPQETILFDAARAKMQTRVKLNGDARYAGWEILCFGRRAAGEKFIEGALRQSTQIERDGVLIWNECAVLNAGDRVMTSPIGMNNATVNATFIVAAGAMPAALLDACRAVMPTAKHTATAGTENFGVSALPEIFAARYLGDSTEQARTYFETLWALLRPWYANRPMQRPRIWST